MKTGRSRVHLASVGAFALLLALPSLGEAQSWRTVTMSRQLSDEEELDVRIRFGAGRLNIEPGEAGALYRMHLRYDEESFATYTAADGLLGPGLLTAFASRDGVAYMGGQVGIMRVDRSGFTQLTSTRGLMGAGVTSIAQIEGSQLPPDSPF